MSASSRTIKASPHDKPLRSSWWLAMMCALLLCAPSGAAPLSLAQTRQAAQQEAVFAWLQRAQAAPETRAQVLQTLCDRAGLDELHTARILSSYQNWTQNQTRHDAIKPASTCSHALAVPTATHFLFAPCEGFNSARALHALTCCYLE